MRLVQVKLSFRFFRQILLLLVRLFLLDAVLLNRKIKEYITNRKTRAVIPKRSMNVLGTSTRRDVLYRIEQFYNTFLFRSAANGCVWRKDVISSICVHCLSNSGRTGQTASSNQARQYFLRHC